MVEAKRGLKIQCRGHLQWHVLPTEFYKNLPTGSKVDGEQTQTHRLQCVLISLLFLPFGKESRLKGVDEIDTMYVDYYALL
jgi:hypothetical protein